MDNKIDKSILGETHWLDDSKKEMLKMLRGIATSEVDLNKMREELKYSEDDKISAKCTC